MRSAAECQWNFNGLHRIRVRDEMAQRIALWPTREELLAEVGLTEDDLLRRRCVKVDPADADYPHSGPLRPLTG